MIKTIIVDDHVLFRMGTRLALEGKSGIEIVGEAASGRTLFELMERQLPDVVLLDLLLPDMHGIEIARIIKERYPVVKILILSGENPENVVEDLMEIGVDGYVTKSASLIEIEKAVASVANGMEYFGRDIAQVLFAVVTAKRKQKVEIPALTNRETEIVRLCSDGLLSKEIAEKLNITHHTVNFHKNNIFRKLGINNTVELAKYAMKNGLISMLLLFVFSQQLLPQSMDDMEVANRYFLEAKNDSALNYLDRAIENPAGVKDRKQVFEAYLLRSRVLGNLQLFERAMADAISAQKIGREIGSNDAKAKSLLAIGKVHYMMYNDSIAETYLLQAKTLAQDSGSPTVLMQVSNALAQLYSVLERNEACLALAEESLELAKRHGNTFEIIQNLNLFAAYYINLNRWTDPIIAKHQKKAKIYLEEALQLATAENIPVQVISTKLHLIRYYRVEKDYPKALETARELIEACEPNHFAVLIQVYDHLVAIYAHLGEKEKVIDSHQQFYLLMRRQSDYNLHQSLQEMKVKHETAEKELEINRQALVITRQKTQRTVLGSISILLTAVIALVWYLMRLQSKRTGELAELNATKDKFFSLISHDLKSPAIAQRNALQGLIDHSGELDAQSLKQYYSELIRSADSQIELLYNLLNWAQLQLGKYTFRPQPFDLRKIIDDESELLYPLLNQKNIALDIQIPEQVEITADKAMLASVVRNLLTNAAKFTPAGGKIILEITQEADKTTVSVADNGIGMNRQQLGTLFDIDRNNSRTGTDGESGSGLGLVICKEILEKHNSQLHVESSEDKGSRFWFRL